MKPPKDFISPLALVGCFFYFLAIISLFPGPTQNATVPAAPRDIALAICSLGILSALAWVGYVRRTAATTLRTYFSRMVTAFVIMAVSILTCYVDSIIARLGRVDPPQLESLVVLNFVLAAAIIYAFIRGSMSIRSQCKTREDVFEFVRRSRLVALEESRVHDHVFYGGVIISIDILARTYNAWDLVIHTCGAGMAVLIPYVCGGVISRYLVVKRLFPDDAPLPAELQT